MENLKNIRENIDAIDAEIASLVKKRLMLASEVAQTKMKSGAVIFDPARERSILSRVADMVGPDYENAALRIFQTLFEISRARQRIAMNGENPLASNIRKICAETPASFPERAIVACPGTEGSYAQQAISLIFKLPAIVYINGFEKVFDAVEQGLCPYGILPIENSAAGSIAQVYDLMVKHRFSIVKALKLKINHVLLGARGAKLGGISEVSSHPHALAQCSKFFKSHPGIKTVPADNTAGAAKELARSPDMHKAVIASRACAELYGLDILAEDIADAANNYIRFICISKTPQIFPAANKISVMMSLAHRPRTLNGIISRFSAVGVNLTKLESRPIPGMDFEFRFTFEFKASARDEAVLRLLAELADDPQIEHFTFLGAYEEK